MQHLLARQLEVVAHLPQRHTEDNSTDEEEDGEDDDNDEDDDGSDYDDDDEDDDTGPGGVGSSKGGRLYQCPHPKCRRRRRFRTRRTLTVHYQTRISLQFPVQSGSNVAFTDVKCYEICVFCRDSFSRVRKYIRHKCSVKKERRSKNREFYRKERCAQLRKHANHHLDTMLAQRESLSRDQGGTKKRPLPEKEWSEPDRASKRQMETVHNGTTQILPGDIPALRLLLIFPLLLDCLTLPAVASESGTPIDTEAASLSSFSGCIPGSATPSGCISDTEFAFSHGLQAPIFHSITIPPFFHVEQPQMYSLPSNTPHGLYPSLNIPNGILPQTGDGQTSEGSGGM